MTSMLHAVAVGDSRDPRLRHADRRVGDGDAAAAQVGNTGLDVFGLDADVRHTRRLVGRYGQQLDERIAGQLQIREPHRAVRIADREGFLGAERVAVERERVVVVLRADADVVDAPPGTILGYAHLHDRRPHEQPGQKQH